MMALGASTYALAAAAACSNTVQGTLALVTGPDDGFAQTPKPTSLIVQLIGPDATTKVASVALPTDAALTLPPEPTSNIDIIQVTGFDDADAAVVSGTSLPFDLGAVTSATLNLFVQRTGQFSRLPSADGGTATLGTVPSASPLLTTYFSQFLLIADGTGKSAATQVYDTFLWQVASAAPTLPIAPLSIAYVDGYTGTDAATDAGSVAAFLTLGANGSASWLNLTDSTSVDAALAFDAMAPQNVAVPGDFSAVAGGQTIYTQSGMSYIVGATRLTGPPTPGILRISPTGVLSWANLVHARLGAAATYVEGQGLYVFGGSAASDGGSGAAGIESLSDIQFSATVVASVPTDTTKGAGALALDDGSVLLVGGVLGNRQPAPVRLYSPTFLGGGGDAGSAWASLPVTFVSTQVFGLTATTSPGGASAVVVGTESSSATSAYLLTPMTAKLIPFRVPRSNARALILPNGSLGVVGGDSGTLESFIR